MKALTVKQPWAWLIVAGHKDVENRTWKPPAGIIGQKIVIHASARIPTLGDVLHARHTAAQSGLAICFPNELGCGAAFGTARLMQVVGVSGSPWFFGPYGWVLTDIERWEHPVPFKGRLGLWEFPDDLIPTVKD